MKDINLEKYSFCNFNPNFNDDALFIKEQPQDITFDELSLYKYFKEVWRKVIGMQGMSSPHPDKIFVYKYILKFLSGKTVMGFNDPFEAQKYKLLEFLNYKQILFNAKESGIVKMYTCSQALAILHKILLQYFLDSSRYVIYFQDPQVKENTVYCFTTWRHDCKGIFGGEYVGTSIGIIEVSPEKIFNKDTIIIF